MLGTFLFSLFTPFSSSVHATAHNSITLHEKKVTDTSNNIRDRLTTIVFAGALPHGKILLWQKRMPHE
jgi:hypothetical protein